PAHRYFITDQRPPGERESLAGFGGTYDSDRIVEGRARGRPHVACASFQQPGCPRLIGAVEQLVAFQVACLGDGPIELQQLGRAYRDEPLVEQLLGVHPWPGSPTKTDAGVYAGLHEVGKLDGCMNLDVDVRVLCREIG